MGCFRRVIDREHDGVGADLAEGAQQRGGREVATGGDENLRAKVVAHELVFAHTQARALSAVEVTWTGGKPLENCLHRPHVISSIRTQNLLCI